MIVAAKHDPDEPGDRHAVAGCLPLDNGEVLEQSLALAWRHLLDSGDHLQRRREANSGNVRFCLDQVAISVERYAAPPRPFLQQVLDDGWVQIGHNVL